MKAEQISALLQNQIEIGDFPSAVYLVAEKGEVIFCDALGNAVVEPELISANTKTIYDLASLTKPLITGLLCAKLIEKGVINLSDKIAKYFPVFDTHGKTEVKIQNLLTHSSGFKAWIPFYLLLNSAHEVLDIIASETPETTLNTKVIYSDLNFLMLRFLIEKIYTQTIDKVAQEEIFTPLVLKDTGFNPPRILKNRIAASEKGNEYEKQTCVERGYDVSKYDWRNYEIWGEVHDGNCYFMNGVSGHAGLFSNVDDVLQIAQQFLPDHTTLLKPQTCNLFTTNFTTDLNEARSFAFQLASTPESSASKALQSNSFGHLGFTGTSVWLEPDSERIFILLTNRAHHRKLPFVNINPTRRRFHELATGALNERL